MPSRANALLVFDGDCGFCSTCARWIASRWNCPGNAAAVPSQQLDEVELKRLGLSADDVSKAVWWIEGDRRSGAHLAVARALMSTGGTWGLVGRLLLVPPIRWIAAVGYRIVAHYRYLLPGGTPTCKI